MYIIEKQTYADAEERIFTSEYGEHHRPFFSNGIVDDGNSNIKFDFSEVDFDNTYQSQRGVNFFLRDQEEVEEESYFFKKEFFGEYEEEEILEFL